MKREQLETIQRRIAKHYDDIFDVEELLEYVGAKELLSEQEKGNVSRAVATEQWYDFYDRIVEESGVNVMVSEKGV